MDAYYDRLLSDHLDKYHEDKWSKPKCIVCGAECDDDEDYCSIDCKDTYE